MYPPDLKEAMEKNEVEENKNEILEEKQKKKENLNLVLQNILNEQVNCTRKMYEARIVEAQKQDERKTENDLDGSYSLSESQDSEDGINLNPAQKIDLWKKLQDLMKNQLKEESQIVSAKEQKLISQHKKFYKVHLPREELDKFSGTGLKDFTVHAVFSSKFFDRKKH